MRGPKIFDKEDSQMLSDGVKIVSEHLVNVEAELSELCRQWHATSSVHENKIDEHLKAEGLDNRLYTHVDYFPISPYRQNLLLREIKGVAWNPIGFQDVELSTQQAKGISDLLDTYVHERKEIGERLGELQKDHDKNYHALEELSVIEDPYGQELGQDITLFVSDLRIPFFYRCDVGMLRPPTIIMQPTDVPVKSFLNKKRKQAFERARLSGRSVYMLHIASPLLDTNVTAIRALEQLAEQYFQEHPDAEKDPYYVSVMRGGPNWAVFNPLAMSPQEVQLQNVRDGMQGMLVEQVDGRYGDEMPEVVFTFDPHSGDDDDTVH